MIRGLLRLAWSLALVHLGASVAEAQPASYRGFADLRGFVFPQDAVNDPVNVVADALFRLEGFVEPLPWLQLAGGLDLRANTHEQVDASWRLDYADRGVRRPALSVRRVAATLSRGPLTVEVGKHFVRWGKTDIVTPTDRFAPRDFLTVLDSEFLAVRGARVALEGGRDSVEVVWVPFFTPSRTPLVDQRWTVPPPGYTLVDAASDIPGGSQGGVRWTRQSGGVEFAVSFFDGFNHLPNIDVMPDSAGPTPTLGVRRRFPALRSYGGDLAVPTHWFTVKVESAYFTTNDPATDEYVLYVIQLERQTGEWSMVGWYAGEAVTSDRPGLSFAPDRGFSRSVVGRASYTIDTNRSAAAEAAVRQDGDGFYAKAEYSHARGQHWRGTATGVLIRGEPDDFLGQYRLNSHVTIAIRYSF